jgi:hypothetical protein
LSSFADADLSLRATYANCFLPAEETGELLLTDEVTVAAAAPPRTRVAILDEQIDFDRAQALNVELWELAYSWFRQGGEDPTIVDGISVGDVSGAEAALTILLPAARGVLDATVARQGAELEELTLALASGGAGHNMRIESVQADAFAAALAAHGEGLRVRTIRSRDPRNRALFAKFNRTRDVDWIAPEARARVRLRGWMVSAVNLRSTWRPPSAALAVLEYNPTRAFARAYASDPRRTLRLLRLWPARADLRHVYRAGDRALYPSPATKRSPLADRPLREVDQQVKDRLVIDGVPIWPVVEPHLRHLVSRYAEFVRGLGRVYRSELARSAVRAVLVPFDTPPQARLLVRVAQRAGVPTLLLNDGFKADDFLPDGLAVDVALAWSPSVHEHYYRRRAGPVIVTGNPRADTRPRRLRPQSPPTRLLVGGFTFSPIDLNCRRSDPETFLESVLEGIRRSSHRGARVKLKLHPADESAHYARILSRYDALAIDVVSAGDVLDLFDQTDLYITTYSTSLIEAVAMGLPVIYYRVNLQRLHPPFAEDSFLEQRTADSPEGLAVLLDHAAPEFASDDERRGWAERYLGPLDGGSVGRVLAAVERTAGVATRA